MGLSTARLFHAEFNAEDVVYTFEFYGDDANATITASNFNGIASIEATDDYTVVITLEEPNAAFLPRAAQTFIVPQHYHSEIGEDEYKTLNLADASLSEAQLIAAIAAHPKLMERPILEAGDKAVIGRPPENVLELLP